MERLHIKEHDLPALYCLEFRNKHLHKHKFVGNVTLSNLIKFESDFLTNQLERHYISQPRETLDIFQHNLKAVNSDMLTDLVKSSEKYLVIYMFKEHSPHHDIVSSKPSTYSEINPVFRP